MSGCAATGYAGIPLAAGAADPELQSLARRAQAGDKQAQLDLGIRYEEGRGVPVSPARAERLYRRAAQSSGGVQLVYVPAASPQGRGQTVPFYRGPVVPGLPEAQARLAGLRSLRQGSR